MKSEEIKNLEAEFPGDKRDPAKGCWRLKPGTGASTVHGPRFCREACVAGTRYCAEHQVANCDKSTEE
jgi:hypothetical protein